jgi:hypothetical protein
MVGVTGSIPVAPTTKCPGKSAVLANFSEDDRASQCLNKPRTLPKILTELGNAWAIRSCKVHWRRLSECALRGTLKLQSERWWMRRADALRLENPSASSLSDQHPASLPKVAARGLVSTSMRSRQEPGKMYRGFESHSLRHRPKIYRFSGVTCPAVWALCAAVSALASGLSAGRFASFCSLTGLFSPKLCTTAIWYKASRVPIYGYSLE